MEWKISSDSWSNVHLVRLLEFCTSGKIPKLHCECAILEETRNGPVSLPWPLVQLLPPLYSKLEVLESFGKRRRGRTVLCCEVNLGALRGFAEEKLVTLSINGAKITKKRRSWKHAMDFHDSYPWEGNVSAGNGGRWTQSDCILLCVLKSKSEKTHSFPWRDSNWRRHAETSLYMRGIPRRFTLWEAILNVNVGIWLLSESFKESKKSKKSRFTQEKVELL